MPQAGLRCSSVFCAKHGPSLNRPARENPSTYLYQRCSLIYVCMYVCLFVCMYVCMYVYLCMYVCMCVCVYACMYVCMYAMHVRSQRFRHPNRFFYRVLTETSCIPNQRDPTLPPTTPMYVCITRRPMRCRANARDTLRTVDRSGTDPGQNSVVVLHAGQLLACAGTLKDASIVRDCTDCHLPRQSRAAHRP